MRVKVISTVWVYNGKTYHEGDYVEIGNEEELEIMVQERCVVESQVTKKGVKGATEKAHYIPSGDTIEEALSSTDKKKGRRK